LAAVDWLEAGFDTLAREGVVGLTIDRLADQLRVTKGSFYHHFAGGEEFKVRLLEYWERRLTLDVIEQAEVASEPRSIMDGLVDALTRNPPNAERAIRAWSLTDDVVRGHLARVDEMRVERAAAWFRTTMREADANVAARSLAALLVGCYSIVPPVTNDELRRIVAGFLGRYDAASGT
jgi:AcrR family transcriptional regulator